MIGLIGAPMAGNKPPNSQVPGRLILNQELLVKRCEEYELRFYRINYPVTSILGQTEIGGFDCKNYVPCPIPVDIPDRRLRLKVASPIGDVPLLYTLIPLPYCF